METNKLVKLSDVEKLIKNQMEIVIRSLEPYELDLPDFKNNPTLSLNYILNSLPSLPTQNVVDKKTPNEIEEIIQIIYERELDLGCERPFENRVNVINILEEIIQKIKSLPTN